MATTTIKNDPATLAAAHLAYSDAITAIRSGKIGDVGWTIVFQPLLPEWTRKGDPNPLGLAKLGDEALVIINFTVSWADRKDDDFIKSTTRNAVEQIDSYANAHGTGNRYRYLNYCAEWQRSFEEYGEENWRLLREASSKYDPEGLFQKGCVGGFKLDVVDGF